MTSVKFGHAKKKLVSALVNPFGKRTNDVTHVIETADWVIAEVGNSITRSLNEQRLLRARVSYNTLGLRDQIVHFDSIGSFAKNGECRFPHPSNTTILTWFHILENDRCLSPVVRNQHRIAVIHTACSKTKQQLIEAGVEEQKVVVIPLGIDLSAFQPVSPDSRARIRQELGIEPERFVIGSFQKDGVGWGEGMEPKLIKGPDVFIETVARLKQHNPLVLLTGPSRGYVKQGLEKRGIEYRHVYPKSFDALPRFYHALDLYIIASRIEGGPKAILEAWASGVPLVSTHVGMVPDIAEDGMNAVLCDVEDVDGLARACERIIDGAQLAQRLTGSGLEAVQNYSWNRIAKRYFDELYAPRV